MRKSPAVVRRPVLEKALWGEELPDSDSLRSHVHQLRQSDRPNQLCRGPACTTCMAMGLLLGGFFPFFAERKQMKTKQPLFDAINYRILLETLIVSGGLLPGYCGDWCIFIEEHLVPSTWRRSWDSILQKDWPGPASQMDPRPRLYAVAHNWLMKSSEL